MSWQTPVRVPAHGEIVDMGYGEFMVDAAFAEELLDGGMTHVNGAPVRLWVVDRFDRGIVLIRWRPVETLEDIAASVTAPTLAMATKE